MCRWIPRFVPAAVYPVHGHRTTREPPLLSGAQLSQRPFERSNGIRLLLLPWVYTHETETFARECQPAQPSSNVRARVSQPGLWIWTVAIVLRPRWRISPPFKTIRPRGNRDERARFIEFTFIEWTCVKAEAINRLGTRSLCNLLFFTNAIGDGSLFLVVVLQASQRERALIDRKVCKQHVTDLPRYSTSSLFLPSEHNVYPAPNWQWVLSQWSNFHLY